MLSHNRVEMVHVQYNDPFLFLPHDLITSN